MTVAHERTIKRLAAKFAPSDRYANFGHFLESITVHGIRGISRLPVEFKFPVSVISGPNGSGKSTIAHAALCVQRQEIDGRKPFNLNHFFLQSSVDQNLIDPNASIYSLFTWDQEPSPRYSRLYRNIDRWRGYEKRIDKGIIYIGLLVYLPKVERRDLSVNARTRLRPGVRTPIEDGARLHINRILGLNATAIDIQNLRDSSRQIDVFCVSRGGTTAYSESNMGLGEGRVIKMVTEIEAAPPKSMIVIDEPEIALHEGAQAKLAHYFADAADRLGHQFILTSHSHALIGELPPEALIYIERRSNRVVSVEGATYREAKALLSSSNTENTIWVEDLVSKSILENLLRRIDPSLLKSTKVCVVEGGASAIKAAMKSLQKVGIVRAAVLDADQKESVDLGIICLPGSRSPEEEIFSSPSVIKILDDDYDLSEESLDAIKSSKNSHSWFYDVAEECAELIDNIMNKTITTYVKSISDDDVADFSQKLRLQLSKTEN